MLISVHMMGSTILRVPELVIDKTEAHALAEAANEVMKHYPLVIDERTAAWMNLGMVACGVYGTRILAAHNRIKRERVVKLGTAAAPDLGSIPIVNGVYIPTPPEG